MKSWRCPICQRGLDSCCCPPAQTSRSWSKDSDRCPSCYETGSIGAAFCECPAGARLSARLAVDERANKSDPQVKARHVRQKLQTEPALTDPVTERRLLASLIAEPTVLAMADELEEPDFSDPRRRYVLRAIRRLRSDSADVGLDEIDHELKLQDMERERIGSGAVADKAGFWFVADLLLGFTPYRDQRVLVEHDIAWLRELADRRRNLTP